MLAGDARAYAYGLVVEFEPLPALASAVAAGRGREPADRRLLRLLEKKRAQQRESTRTEGEQRDSPPL
jgi:hypothetical protein